MPVELLIDGYNLLYNAGLGTRKFAPGQFEQSRAKLLKRLKASLSEEERQQTTIVFDAQYSEHPDRRPVHAYGMTILFSARGRQADDLIEIILAGHTSPRQILVISSDHRLQRAARIARVAYLSSDAFLVDLEERKTKHAESSDSNSSTNGSSRERESDNSITDAGKWMEEFGDIDISSITQEIQRELSRNEPVENFMAQVTPLPEHPGKGSTHPRQVSPAGSSTDPKSVPPATPENEESVILPNPAELDFWEQRIQEMLAEEDALHKKRRR